MFAFLRSPRLSREVVGVVLLFATYYLGAGVLIPYFPLWLKDRQMGALDIALAVSIPAIARVLAAPAFGYMGDHYGKRRMIRVMAALALSAMVLLGVSASYWPILLLTSLVYICWQSMPLQMDALAIDLVRRKAVAGYGLVRAFGSLAFILSTFVGSLILTWRGSESILAYFILVIVLLLAATRQIAADAGGVPPRAGEMPASVWLRPELVSVLAAAAMVHGAHAAFINFGALHMRNLGFSNMTMATVFAVATGAEIAFFFLGHLISSHLRPIQWIALGAAVAVVRWCSTAVTDEPLVLLMLQLLHALTFSGTFTGMIGYIVATVDPRQVASAQGVYIAMFGIFNAALSFGVGAIFEAHGGRSFLLSAALAAVALLLLAFRAVLFAPSPHEPPSGE